MNLKKSLQVTLALVIVALIAALLISAINKPDNFRIERSITINASPDQVFPFINEFPEWTRWSPWEEKDPDLKRTYSGAISGVGAIYAWEGNNAVGHGRMEITESIPFVHIVIALEFIKPFKAHNTASFTFTPVGDDTQVIWAMEGPNNFFSKLMQVFMSMEEMVGKDFDDGLNRLKAVAEANLDSPHPMSN